MSDNVCESSSFEKLHDNPELIFNQVTVVHLNDVGVMVVAHDYNLQQIQLDWLRASIVVKLTHFLIKMCELLKIQ